MTNCQSQRKTSLLTWALVLTRLLLLLIFLTLAAHVSIGLGHWPTPMWENYQTIAYTAHEQFFVWFALFTVYAAIPLWLLALCFRPLRISRRTHLLQAGAYAAGWGFIALYATWDPGRFTEWFLD
jgi:hypothetical protein